MKKAFVFSVIMTMLLLSGCGKQAEKDMTQQVIIEPIGEEQMQGREGQISAEEASGIGEPSFGEGDSPKAEKDKYAGEYNDYDNNEPNLEIQREEDGTYRIQIGIFRLIFLDDCVGKASDHGIEFTANVPGGNPLNGTITVDGDIATVTFTSAEWSNYSIVSEYQYYKISDTPDSLQSEDNVEGQILDQSFVTELDGFGRVIFAPFEPLTYPSENPDYGTTMFGDVRFMLLSPADGEKIYDFPGETQDNILVGSDRFKQVLSVAFKDCNEDGRVDILLLLEYEDSAGRPFRRARVYTQDEGKKEFGIDGSLSEYLKDYTESMGRIYEGINSYRQETAFALEDASGTLTAEEKLLNEKMEYYQKSAYYEEMTEYWENVRGVRDISNRIVPLYSSDRRYLTRENLAFDPPVVIHLAKNEIYARHGYIFSDQDVYNYFMGCLWYTPTTSPEDFKEEVFNDYEKENLKLLSELDTL